jgi:hypothetical protein
MSMALVTAALGMVMLSSCSSTAPTAPKHPEKSAVVTPTTESVTLPSYRNDVMRRPEVKLTSCAAAPGGWTASGVITNLATTSHDFVLTVFFTDSSATVLASGKTSVTVDAKRSGRWHITAQFASPKVVLCALVGVA